MKRKRKIEKISPEEWVSIHVDRKRDKSDLYYTAIANSVYDTVNQTELGYSLDGDETKRKFALCLTSWFEDIVTDLGIWKTFTDLFKHRYGTFLPFYKTEKYIHGKVNLEDVSFLLWHYIQKDLKEEILVDPENPTILQLSERVYNIFIEVYEEAPINETLKNYFTTLSFDRGNFYHYLNILDWFYYKCYLNYGSLEIYERTLLETIEETTEILGEEIDKKSVDMLSYSVHIANMICNREGLLSYTSPQWLAKIFKNHKQYDLLNEVRGELGMTYVYLKEDEKYIYVQKILDKEVYPVLKISLDIKNENKLIPLQSVISTNLIRYAETWWQSGSLFVFDINDEIVSEVRNEIEYKEIFNDIYEKFVIGYESKSFVFFPSKKEMLKSIKKSITGKNSLYTKMLKQIDADIPLAISATKEDGLVFHVGNCDCLKSDDNPLYDENKAKKEAHYFVIAAQSTNYLASCKMIDEGMLIDARVESVNGEDRGYKLFQDNINFLNDYFHNQCREIDVEKLH